MARKYPIALQDWSQPPSYATVILEGKQLQFVYTLNKSTFIHLSSIDCVFTACLQAMFKK